MDRTAVFNNAGVRFLQAGLYTVAGEMLQAALEESLIFAKPGEEGRNATRENVKRAEMHLNNMDAILLLSQESSSPQRSSAAAVAGVESEPSSSSTTQTATAGDENAAVSEDDVAPHPYMYTNPILLDTNTENTSLQLTGAIIIFNLALVQHKKRRTSNKEKKFLNIAEALIQCEVGCYDPRVLLLQVGVANNYGVWLYEKGNIQEASERSDRLRVMYSTFGTCLPPQVQEGIQSNLQWRTTTAAPSFLKILPVV
jgi:hypothetical protein